MELMTIKEAAEKLGVSENWVYSHLRVRRPLVPHARLGGNIRFREADPRRRDERGWVKKVGKIQRMWEGYFNVYVRMADGSERRRRHSRILGPCVEMTKNQAMDELRKIILKERGMVSVVVTRLASVGMPPNSTFADIWQRYRANPKGCGERL